VLVVEEVKFDFAKAQSLMGVLTESEKELAEVLNMLGSELKEIGLWWDGESFEAFSEKYGSTGKNADDIRQVSKLAKDANSHVSKIADAKKTHEQQAAKFFY
jgi:uncharacterized protein YukE